MKPLIITVLIGIVLLTACNGKPLSTESTANHDFKVELLFEHDGYRIYRFRDGGRTVYFTAPATTVRTSHQEGCGKNCWHTVEDATLAVP